MVKEYNRDKLLMLGYKEVTDREYTFYSKSINGEHSLIILMPNGNLEAHKWASKATIKRHGNFVEIRAFEKIQDDFPTKYILSGCLMVRS